VEVTQIIMERMANNILKWYGYQRRMGDESWSMWNWPGGRKEEKEEEDPKRSG